MIDWTAVHGDAFAGRRALVTGGAGFIGSHLCEALAALGAEVVAIDDLSAGDWANLADAASAGEAGTTTRIRRITGSVLDRGLLDEAIDGCTWVFHQAALGSVPASIEHPNRYYRANVQGTVEVAEAARRAGVQRVIFAASSSAYGDSPETAEAPKHEDLPPRPQSPYAATKLAGEHTIRAWWHAYGLDGACLRYFNIFGPRQSPYSAYAAVIAAFADRLHQHQPGRIFGDGGQTRDFTHVDNAVHANLLAARHAEPLHGEVLNVAAGERVTLNELYREMAALFDCADLSPTYEPVRPGDVRHSQAELSRIRATLGYEPLVGLRQGLDATVRWYRQYLAQ